MEWAAEQRPIRPQPLRPSPSYTSGFNEASQQDPSQRMTQQSGFSLPFGTPPDLGLAPGLHVDSQGFDGGNLAEEDPLSAGRTDYMLA